MSEITDLQDSIEQMEDLIKAKKSVLALKENAEFKEIVLERFMKEEVIRNAGLSTDPRMKAELRADALLMSQAPGYLDRFLNFILQIGTQAEQSLPEAKATLIELMQENN